MKWKANVKIPLKASKISQVEWLGKNITKLVMGIHMANLYIPFLIVVSQLVEYHVCMLGLGVEDWVFGNALVLSQRSGTLLKLNQSPSRLRSSKATGSNN